MSAAIFDDVLGVMGQSLLWRSSDLCPCRDPYSGAARAGCPNCAGRGVIWAAPVSAWTGLASQRVAREWAAFGLWESGDTVCTIPSDSPFYAAGENDRAVFTQSSEPFRALYTYSSGVVQVLPFTVAEFDRVFWLDPSSQSVVDGTLPTQNADGSLAWGSSGVPPDGVQYTLRGRKNPEYFLFRDFPQDRAHFGGAALPRRVVLRKFDLFGR